MSISVRAIEASDLPAVGQFLHTHLNPRLSPAEWAASAVVEWPVPETNHGFLLEDDSEIVGAYLAFYSTREIDGVAERFCNLGAWCVHEAYRAHSIRLVKAMISQRGYTFTDLSPSGTVVPLNERLRFEHLDTATALIPGLPYPTRPGRIRLLTDPQRMQAQLDDAERQIFRDHRHAGAARHLVITRTEHGRTDHCYVIYRRDRRKNLPVFASILYVSNREVFAAGTRALARHLLLRHRVLATLAELRVVTHRPRPSKMLSAPRRKMFKSPNLESDKIDYLYSELVCVAW